MRQAVFLPIPLSSDQLKKALALFHPKIVAGNALVICEHESPALLAPIEVSSLHCPPENEAAPLTHAASPNTSLIKGALRCDSPRNCMA